MPNVHKEATDKFIELLKAPQNRRTLLFASAVFAIMSISITQLIRYEMQQFYELFGVNPVPWWAAILIVFCIKAIILYIARHK